MDVTEVPFLSAGLAGSLDSRSSRLGLKIEVSTIPRRISPSGSLRCRGLLVIGRMLLQPFWTGPCG